MATIFSFPDVVACYRFLYWSYPRLFYDDAGPACRRLFVDCLCPALYHQYSYAKRHFGIQLPGAVTQSHAMDALCRVCFHSYFTPSWLFGVSGMARFWKFS